MKKKILLAANSFLLITFLAAQTETFDIATFTPPTGWQRIDSNGVVAFFDSKTANGLTSFCQIFLYPSRRSSGNASTDFKTEWNLKVTQPARTNKKPKTQTEKTPDGWNIVTGYANLTQPGLTYTCMLMTATGFGKTMSVLVNIAGKDYVTVVDQFFKDLELNKDVQVKTNNPNNQISGVTGPASLSNYIYTPPPGWTTKQFPDGIVLSSPAVNTGEICRITLFPMRSTSGNLQNDANNLFAEVFKGFQLSNSTTTPSMIKGMSPHGWEYFIIKRVVVATGGDYQALYGFAFVAKLGNEVAAIVGTSKDPKVSSCFGLIMTDVWPNFFYSLQFKNWKGNTQQNEMAKSIAGVWMAATGSAGDRWVFAANGRFAGTAAAQRYMRLSSTELLRVTDAFFGDGSYQINGNGIMLIHDSEKNNPEPGLFRVEMESKDEGRNWSEKLYLRRRALNGTEYEVAYDKQNI